jgi:hypothetical protein
MESAGTQEKNDAVALMQQTLARLDGRELAIKQRPGWVAVPHETGGDFSTQDARRIAAAAADTCDSDVWMIAGISEPFEVYAVQTTARALEEARNALATTNVVILPRSGRWLYLASEAEFGVAIGSESSVAVLTGRDPAEGRSAFQRYLGDWQSVPPILNAVADAPWETYSELGIGHQFVVRWR